MAGSVLVGIAVAGRLWCALYISGYKSNTLITTGPYSMCRNPLYFFSFLGAIGVGLATETISIPVFIVLGFATLYPLVILSEEKKLAYIHKDAFSSYCKKTPLFFPLLKLLNEPKEYVVRPIIFRKAAFEALWFVWLLGLVELVESLHEVGILPVLCNLY
ncbi:MAG: isoprenylcysteine carboxylmethyltransferase family protein [Planctomycetaceae bacterium]|nr:isoprenylcysteine carboxylmethyltransferase family protein [Planctomycetaceae bacterium]